MISGEQWTATCRLNGMNYERLHEILWPATFWTGVAAGPPGPRSTRWRHSSEIGESFDRVEYTRTTLSYGLYFVIRFCLCSILCCVIALVSRLESILPPSIISPRSLLHHASTNQARSESLWLGDDRFSIGLRKLSTGESIRANAERRPWRRVQGKALLYSIKYVFRSGCLLTYVASYAPDRSQSSAGRQTVLHAPNAPTSALPAHG